MRAANLHGFLALGANFTITWRQIIRRYSLIAGLPFLSRRTPQRICSHKAILADTFASQAATCVPCSANLSGCNVISAKFKGIVEKAAAVWNCYNFSQNYSWSRVLPRIHSIRVIAEENIASRAYQINRNTYSLQLKRSLSFDMNYCAIVLLQIAGRFGFFVISLIISRRQG